MTQVYRGGERLAEVIRSTFVEGFHYGSAVVLGPDGRVRTGAGDFESPVFPRSSNKPMQTVAALRAGLPHTDPADLAMVSASHRGEPFHVARVRSLLQRSGLTPAALRCPESLPLDPSASHALLAAGGSESRLTMNCSGKHAGMLASCVVAGWPTEDYLDENHELQQLNHATVEEFTGYPIAASGVDGCGAPLFAFPLLGLARAFQRFVEAESGTDARAVADAMRAYPELVSGTRGNDTALMRGVSGLLAKSGAEGVVALAVPQVGAVAVKIDDGAARAAMPVAVAALRSLDLSAVTVDERALERLASTKLRGRGEVVGAVRPVWPKRG